MGSAAGTTRNNGHSISCAAPVISPIFKRPDLRTTIGRFQFHDGGDAAYARIRAPLIADGVVTLLPIRGIAMCQKVVLEVEENLARKRQDPRFPGDIPALAGAGSQ